MPDRVTEVGASSKVKDRALRIGVLIAAAVSVVVWLYILGKAVVTLVSWLL